ncbi:hypothetical protein J1G43_12890 [Cellulomonas sp. zg-ZUI22]|uniref:hypothetical protein n=1 Tax=Cellulomonas sp. zg-ZUI22 TaxID=2816955 RepID=UPI001A940CA7|nr:hypothetical protein [Cellulomonas sp. zg-ZUI22]MBO0900860.1 hypothetical protein [Cellulomonas sp. zg-ZUI22]
MALALTACAGGDGAAPAATDASSSSVEGLTQAPTPTPSPTPTVMSKEQAGAKYLELVAPSNALVAPFNAALEADDVATVRTLCAQSATAYRGFADGLIAAQWPAEVQPAVDRLVTDLAGEISAFATAGASETDDQLWAALNARPAPSGAGQEIRMLLGLGNVPAG